MQLELLPSTVQGKDRLSHTWEEERMVPYSHQAGVLHDRVSRTPLRVLQPSFSKHFVTKPLNFEGISRGIQEHHKGSVLTVPTYEQSEAKGLYVSQKDMSQEKPHLISAEHLHSYRRITSTPSYRKAAAAGGLSRALHGVSCNGETAKKHDVTLCSSQWG